MSMRAHSVLVAVLAAVVTAGPSAAAEPVEQDGLLDVMTFNAWGLPSPIASDRRGRFPKIASFLRDSQADVVGLQEVWQGALSLLPLDGLRYSGSTGDSGLALYSPHPMRGLAFDAFEAERGFDRLKSKGVLRATVEFPGAGPVEVFVTHLQAGGSDANARVRAAQIDQLLGLVGATAGPAVVMGDFNLYEESSRDRHTWSQLREAGLIDVAHSMGNTEPTYADSSYRFDQIYVRSTDGLRLAPAEAQVVRYDDDPDTSNPPFLSDHLPLRVRLKASR